MLVTGVGADAIIVAVEFSVFSVVSLGDIYIVCWVWLVVAVL